MWCGRPILGLRCATEACDGQGPPLLLSHLHPAPHPHLLPTLPKLGSAVVDDWEGPPPGLPKNPVMKSTSAGAFGCQLPPGGEAKTCLVKGRTGKLLVLVLAVVVLASAAVVVVAVVVVVVVVVGAVVVVEVVR